MVWGWKEHRGTELSWEAGSEKAKVNGDGRENSLEKSKAGSRLTCTQQGFLLLCKNEASVQSAPRVPLQDGPKAGQIRLGFRVREGRLSRKGNWPWEQIFKEARLLSDEVCCSAFHWISSNVAYLDHLLCLRPGHGKQARLMSSSQVRGQRQASEEHPD